MVTIPISLSLRTLVEIFFLYRMKTQSTARQRTLQAGSLSLPCRAKACSTLVSFVSHVLRWSWKE